MQIFNNTYLSYVLVWIILNVIKYTYFQEYVDIVNNQNYILFKELYYYNIIVSYVVLCKIIQIMFYMNIVYLYFGLLSKIFNDIKTIIDIHLLYILIMSCYIYDIIPFNFSIQMWLELFGCLYIRNIYVKILNLE